MGILIGDSSEWICVLRMADVEHLENCMEGCSLCDLDEAKLEFDRGVEMNRKRFDALVARVEGLEGEMASKEEMARSKIEALVQAKERQKEKLRALREKYCNLVEQYNALSEEAKERSDSSSSDDGEDGSCSLM